MYGQPMLPQHQQPQQLQRAMMGPGPGQGPPQMQPPPNMVNGGPRPGPQQPQPQQPPKPQDMIKKEEPPAPSASAPPQGPLGAGPSAPTPEHRPATTEGAGMDMGFDINGMTDFLGIDFPGMPDFSAGGFDLGNDWMNSLPGDPMAMDPLK